MLNTRNIMRDNMLVNVSGIPGHAMGIDLNIEHLIGYLKVFHSYSKFASRYADTGFNLGAICSKGNLFQLGPPWQHFSWYTLSADDQKAGNQIAQSGTSGNITH